MELKKRTKAATKMTSLGVSEIAKLTLKTYTE